MFAVTDRLLLRPGWAEDAEALAAAIGDEAIVRNLARAPWPYARSDAEAFLASMADAPLPAFIVTRRADATIVGACGFSYAPSGEIELGYWIARAHWGLGYATEAARAALDIARTLGWPRVEAGAFTDNPDSARVLEKLGFEPTGVHARRFSCGRGAEAISELRMLELAGGAQEGAQAA